ncbi:MAG TPA: UDP-N-acetylmuramate dehydrogenase, partial [Puia sp.]|nr:UDP-N-acetylmuramate dehydrogenase [Puia sp.]
MTLEENVILKPYNTFGIDAYARWWGSFANTEELAGLLGFAANPPFNAMGRALSGPPPAAVSRALTAQPSKPLPVMILGGGSNILLRQDFKGLMLKNGIMGIELVREDERHVFVRAGAGENWHAFVQYCLQRNWAGVENLSLIPGNVGATPMQNIGAYGVEIRDVFEELEAWSLHDNKVHTFSVNDCDFGYRDSVFKQRYKDQFVILNVIFRLNKVPQFHTEYGAIREELGKMGVHELSIQAISEAVIRIRSSKLPDPKEIGNAGSFFKNPVVTAGRFARMKDEFPGIVGYESSTAARPATTDPPATGDRAMTAISTADKAPSPAKPVDTTMVKLAA